MRAEIVAGFRLALRVFLVVLRFSFLPKTTLHTATVSTVRAAVIT